MPQIIHLNPAMPPELAATIARHLEMFEGYSMMADADQAPEAPTETGDQPEARGQSKPAEQLGEPGLKALHEERDARKALERQFTQLREALSGALGDKADPKSGVDEQINALTDELAKLTNQTQIDKLARVHGITDDKDLELLSQTAPEAREALAVRLAPAKEADQPKPERRRYPSADPSQGGRITGQKRPDVQGVDRLAAAFEEADHSN